MGRLKVWDPNYEISFDRGMMSLPGWILIGQAQGDINIPIDQNLRLEVYEDSTDVSFLCDLGPNDIQVLFLQDTKILDEDLIYIKDLTGLKGLDLSSTLITGDGLVHLANLSSLRKLGFFNSQISDEGLLHLPALKSLQHLSLMKTHIKGPGLEALQNLPSLEFLELAHTEIVDDSLAHLAKMKQLKELLLYDTNISDKALSYLKSLDSLEILMLSRHRENPDYSLITDEGLSHLKNLHSLKRLYLERSGITDAGLKHLSNLTKLELLYLDRTQITGEGLAFLENLSALTSLSFNNTNFNSTGMANCKAWSDTLEGLSLDDTKISDDDMSHLAECKALKYLGLANTPITDTGLAHLRGLDSLHHLWLEGTNTTDAGLAHIAKINSLEYINLNNTQITDEGLMLLKDLPKLNSIRVMNTGVTKSGLEKFKKISAGQSITANRRVDLVQTKQQGHETIESEAPQKTRIEPQSLLGKSLPDIKELVKVSGKDIRQNNHIEPAAQPEELIPQKSFLTAEEILDDWLNTYGKIVTMKVAYNTLLIEHKPPANNSEEPTPIPVKHNHVERIEAGKRYHIRYSLAPDGLNNNEWLVEYAFNGETTQSYHGHSNGGSIMAGQRGGSEETENALAGYMFLQNRNAPSYLKDEYPNGMPELLLWFKMGMLRGEVTVRPYMESIAGNLCHIVEIEYPEKKTGPARYKNVFWMAHNKGMCLMKYQWLDNNRQDTYKLESEIEIKVLAVTSIDGVDIWYPIKACGTGWDDQIGTIRKELTVTEFIPNIKVDEDTFNIDFPPGTEVFDKTRNITYIATSRQSKSQLDKTPPKLSDFGTECAQADINGKNLIVCFFDMQQRPSRRYVLELAEQAEKLKEKSITIVAVQATAVDENELDEWVENNNIPFPVGMIEAEEKKIQAAWGVKSLPWLILTKKNHTVIAEGFGINELDEKISVISKN